MSANRQWRLALVDAVVAASARPGDACVWITAGTDGFADKLLADINFPWRHPMGFNTLDAKLSLALSKMVVGEFSRTVQITTMEALELGRRVRGRRLHQAIDQHFELTEADWAVFGMEHILSAVMKVTALSVLTAIGRR